MLRPVLAVTLGLLVAAGYGSGDFLGGHASKSSSTPGVLLYSQLSAAAGAIAVVVPFRAHLAGHDLLFGALAGVGNVTALALLYQGLSTGQMGVVAPVTAVVSAVFPITWGLVQGERPPTAVLVGVTLAVGAGALIGVSSDVSHAGARRAVLLAVSAGICFGGSF